MKLRITMQKSKKSMLFLIPPSQFPNKVSFYRIKIQQQSGADFPGPEGLLDSLGSLGMLMERILKKTGTSLREEDKRKWDHLFKKKTQLAERLLASGEKKNRDFWAVLHSSELEGTCNSQPRLGKLLRFSVLFQWHPLINLKLQRGKGLRYSKGGCWYPCACHLSEAWKCLIFLQGNNIANRAKGCPIRKIILLLDVFTERPDISSQPSHADAGTKNGNCISSKRFAFHRIRCKCL